MSDLPITTIVAGLFALQMVALSLRVSMRRIALDGVILGGQHMPRSIGMTLSHLVFLISGAWLLLVYL